MPPLRISLDFVVKWYLTKIYLSHPRGAGKMLLRIYLIGSTLLNKINEDITSLVMISLFDNFQGLINFCWLFFMFLKMFAVPGILETMTPVMQMVGL